MAEVTVIANLPVLGMERNQRVTIEETPMIRGAINDGKLTEVLPEHLAEDEPEFMAGGGDLAEIELRPKARRARG